MSYYAANTQLVKNLDKEKKPDQDNEKKNCKDFRKQFREL